MNEFAPWFDWSHPLNAVKRRRPTIDELDAILNSEQDVSIEILPNGEVRAIGSTDAAPKPLTMRENLGGEYATAA